MAGGPKVEASLNEGSPALTDALLELDDPSVLGSLAESLNFDRRPAVRRAVHAYLAEAISKPAHRPLIKRLLKLAELSHDDERLAHFLVAFDRLLARRLQKHIRWDAVAKAVDETQTLEVDTSIPRAVNGIRFTLTPKGLAVPSQTSRLQRAGFTRSTRRYLQRRALRYFRQARHDPDRFRQAAFTALMLYRDEHLDTPVKLLDAWGFTGLCYARTPTLEARPEGRVVAEGRSLAELQPSPLFPDAWTANSPELYQLIAEAPARAVRTWAHRLLIQRPGPRRVPAVLLRALVKSPHSEAALTAAEVLQVPANVAHLSIDEWLELLGTENPDTLVAVTAAFERDVAPDRVTPAQRAGLAQARLTPVAKLGWRLLSTGLSEDRASIATVLAVVQARNPAVRALAASWVISAMKTVPDVPMEWVRGLIDATDPAVRASALELLQTPRFSAMTELWLAMAQTPYPEVRAALLAGLETRLSSFDTGSLERLWASSLLAVHGGGRHKRAAALQVAQQLVVFGASPEARSLLQLLGHLLRSLRTTDRTAALVALTQACVAQPGLKAMVARAIPELDLSGVTSSSAEVQPR